ncbi:MAG TPA: hypothetical protein VMT85_09825 [Thermoanaerobaculia bacterium]|nr:hypothetical protein [Thermoanaerobaculia bacterium]
MSPRDPKRADPAGVAAAPTRPYRSPLAAQSDALSRGARRPRPRLGRLIRRRLSDGLANVGWARLAWIAPLGLVHSRYVAYSWEPGGREPPALALPGVEVRELRSRDLPLLERMNPRWHSRVVARRLEEFQWSD